MDEEWKQVSYAPNYEISTLGNVKNKTTNKILYLNYERVKKTNTRMRVGLSQNGKIKGYYLHRIVAQHFIENPDELPEVNHIDGDCYNNKASNLEWISKINNMRHARDNNLVTTYKRKVLIKNKLTGEETLFDSITECANYLNSSAGTITLLCNNKYGKSCDEIITQKRPSRQVIQFNENNEIINTFDSIAEAQNKLNLNNISSCCNYYEYDDLTRPKCYKCCRISGFIFKFGKIRKRQERRKQNQFQNFEISYLTNQQNDTKYKEKDEENIIWKEYPLLEKYMVSNTGEVKHKRTNRILQGSKVNGYRFVGLKRDDQTSINRLIHRLVAQTFLENPENKPVVNHKDTNILNNHVDNLEWVTYKENLNTKETISNLKKGKNSKFILQIDIETGKVINRFYGASEGEEKTNIKTGTILNMCHHYKGDKSYSQKRYQQKYIFIFEEDCHNLDKYLQIANDYNCQPKKKKVLQIDKKTNNIINTFESGYAASKKLNISYSGISNCCHYYKYNDDERPKCYTLKSYKGFIFKQELNQTNFTTLGI